MSAAEDQKQILQGALSQALAALQGLDEEQRAAVPADALAQLEQVVSYAQLVVERTSPELISTTAHAALNGAVAPIAADPLTCLASPQAHADAVINSLSGFPAAQDRDVEQTAEQVIAGFESAASERIAALHGRATSLEGELATLSDSIASESTRLNSEIETAGTTLKTTVESLATTAQASVDTLITNLQAKVTEFEGILTTQRAALDEVRATQSEAFSTSQGERATAFQEELTRAREELSELDRNAHAEVGSRVDESDDGGRRLKLVGAIGLAGTAERYGKQAEGIEEGRRLTRLTTSFWRSAPCNGDHRSERRSSDQWHGTAAKLAVSAVFGVLPRYWGAVGRHRARGSELREPFSSSYRPSAPSSSHLDKISRTSNGADDAQNVAISGATRSPGRDGLRTAWADRVRPQARAAEASSPAS